MPEIHISAERVIAAPPEHLYTLIADYHRHHPQFLPAAFSDFKVEQGGVGEGTIISYRLKAGGRERTCRARIAEPEPGRVLTESDLNSSLVTTFTVTPTTEGCCVRFDTRWQGGSGFGGLMERLFAPHVLRGLYDEELQLLDDYARRTAGKSG